MDFTRFESSNGFLMVECLITLVFFTLSIYSLTLLYGHCCSQTRENSSALHAINEWKSIIELLRDSPAQKLMSSATSDVGIGQPKSIQPTIINGPLEGATITPCELVELSLKWRTGNGNTRKIVWYMMNRAGTDESVGIFNH